jgi:hypothetical protein
MDADERLAGRQRHPTTLFPQAAVFEPESEDVPI